MCCSHYRADFGECVLLAAIFEKPCCKCVAVCCSVLQCVAVTIELIFENVCF